MERQANGFLRFPKNFATNAVHAAQNPDQWSSSPVVLPIVTSATFEKSEPQFTGFYYGRCGNPTRETLEQVLAILDNAKYGIAFSSGLGAVSTLVAMFKSGDHIICTDGVFGGTDCYFREISTNFNIETTFVDCVNTNNVEKAIKSNTKMIFIETPANPLMTICDIEAIAKISKKHNVLCVVDNTFLTSYLQRPLNLGADIALYSLSKYMNGHADVIMGCITTNDKRIYEKVKFLQTYIGTVPGPFDCYQANRGMKTLALRMQKHLQNGMVVAQFLEKHPKVVKVLHPGLPSHPQYQLAKNQSCGHSGTFSFYIKGDFKTSEKFMKRLKVISLAASLGGVDSVIEIPATMSHLTVPVEHLEEMGITGNLIRISVGIEDADDLISDLDQALAKI